MTKEKNFYPFIIKQFSWFREHGRLESMKHKWNVCSSVGALGGSDSTRYTVATAHFTPAQIMSPSVTCSPSLHCLYLLIAIGIAKQSFSH